MEDKKQKGGFIKNYGALIASVIMILMVIGVFVQNGSMIDKMDKILNDSATEVHELYDDTNVINAYKSGDPAGLDDKEKFLYDILNKVIPEIITDDMNVYEKEKACYDWVYNVTHFSDESLDPMNAADRSDTYTPYGVINNHEAICVGNATTFKLFMDAIDIPCKIVHSTASGEHAWDVVQLDDDWYHVDLTFDGGDTEPMYSQLNLPDSIKDDGSWPYDHSEIPACKGTKYCYILQNAKELKNLYAIPQYLTDRAQEGGGIAAIILKDPKGCSSHVAEFIANNLTIDGGTLFFQGVYGLEGKSVFTYEINMDSEYTIPSEIQDKLSPIIDKLNENVYNVDNYDEEDETIMG